MELLNETTILTSLYFCYTFCYIIPEAEYRYNIGWIFTGGVLLNVLINFTLIVATLVKNVAAAIKSRRKKSKQKRLIAPGEHPLPSLESLNNGAETVMTTGQQLRLNQVLFNEN